MEGVSKAAANPMGRITQTASGFGSTLSGGGFTGEGNLFSDFVPAPSAAAGENLSNAKTTNLASDQFAADTATGATERYTRLFAQQGAGPKPAAFTPDAGAEFVQSPDATYKYSAEKLATTPPEFMTPSSTSAVGGDGFMDTAKVTTTRLLIIFSVQGILKPQLI